MIVGHVVHVNRYGFSYVSRSATYGVYVLYDGPKETSVAISFLMMKVQFTSDGT